MTADDMTTDEMAADGPLWINNERDGASQRIQPIGELDIATAPVLERELNIAAAGDAAIIVVDLGGLTFLDSSGVHVLLRANSSWGSRENRLRVITGPPVVDRVFGLAGVRSKLPIVAGERSHSMPRR